MSSTSAPFGLKPVLNQSGTVRTMQYSIDPAYTTAIYNQAACKLHTDGTVRAAAAGDSLLGSFMGCEYTNALGSRKVSPFWTGETGATDIICYVTSDPSTLYEIQADGSVATSKIGESGDITNAASGSSTTGFSATTITATTAAAQATLQVIGIPVYPDNVAGDSFTIVRVKIAEHQLAAAYSGV